MRGRKPTPRAVNDVKGNPGKRKKRDDVPEPPVETPECPAHLGDSARLEWGRIAPALASMGVLARVDRAALAGYCVAYARWQDAEAQIIATGGEVVKAPSGYPIQNPYLAIANKALEQVHKFAAEFGMTPSSRTRIAVKDGNSKPKDPAEDFFSGPRAVA